MKKNYLTSSRVLLIFGAFFIGLTLVAHPCEADEKTDAKQKFKEGMAAIEKENYPAALTAFQDSYKLIPKPSLLYNIAMCQKAMFRYVDSIATFKSFLNEAGEKIKPEMAEASKKALREMDGLVGKLKLEAAPDGAKVYVDGKLVGETPDALIVLLDPGRHTVRVTLKGHKSLETEITVASGSVVGVRAPLTKVAAWLGVECEDPDAVVRLDGKVAGGCPFEGEVDPGEHTVAVKAPGKPAFQKTINIESGGSVTVAVELSEEGSTMETGESSKRPLVIAGIVSTVVGAGAAAMGIGFNVKGNKDEQSALDAEPYSKKRSDFNDAVDKDKIGMMVGYISAGVFIATGVILIAVGKGGENSDEAVSFITTPSGVAFIF